MTVYAQAVCPYCHNVTAYGWIIRTYGAALAYAGEACDSTYSHHIHPDMHSCRICLAILSHAHAYPLMPAMSDMVSRAGGRTPRAVV